MRGNHRVSIAALLIGSVVLAGCSGAFLGPETSAPRTTEHEPSPQPATATEPATPTATETASNGSGVPERQNITVTNYHSAAVTVTVHAVGRPVTKLRLTSANGSVQTDARSDYDAGLGWPYGPYWVENLTSVTPANTTELGRWSTVVAPGETASLPTLATRENVTYLVVVSLSSSGRVLTAALPTCVSAGPDHPTVAQFTVRIGEMEGADEDPPLSGSGSSTCT